MGACKDVCVGFAKCILFVLNLIILIFAIVMVVKGVMMKNAVDGLDLGSVSSFAIVIGVIMAFIAFAGCWGAIRENPCCLTIYAGVLLTLFVIQIILAILAFVTAGREPEAQQVVLKHLTVRYNNLNDTNNLAYINHMQQDYLCCGLRGPNGTEVALNSTVIMSSCCPEMDSVCTPRLAYQDGCVNKVTDFMIGSLMVSGIITIFFALIELICATFAFCVRGNIRKDTQLLP